MTTHEEYYLLQKLREGDMSAMEILYIRHAPQVKSFVFAIMKSVEETDDIVQDIFLKVWEERAVISQARSFRSYLYTMTRNIVYNRLKHRKVQTKYAGDFCNRQDLHDIEGRIITKDLLAHINEQMENLTEQQKVIYELKRNSDMTYKEIADKLGISPKTVQYHMNNILNKLKKLL